MIPDASQLRQIIVQSMDDGHNVKCPRCWHWHGVTENFGHLPEEIEAKPELAREKLCDKCQSVILRDFPDHPSAPHIRAALRAQHDKYTVKLPWWLWAWRWTVWKIKKAFK